MLLQNAHEPVLLTDIVMSLLMDIVFVKLAMKTIPIIQMEPVVQVQWKKITIRLWNLVNRNSLIYICAILY